jgi:hypothetical protein
MFNNYTYDQKMLLYQIAKIYPLIKIENMNNIELQKVIINLIKNNISERAQLLFVKVK